MDIRYWLVLVLWVAVPLGSQAADKNPFLAEARDFDVHVVLARELTSAGLSNAYVKNKAEQLCRSNSLPVQPNSMAYLEVLADGLPVHVRGGTKIGYAYGITLLFQQPVRTAEGGALDGASTWTDGGFVSTGSTTEWRTDFDVLLKQEIQAFATAWKASHVVVPKAIQSDKPGPSLTVQPIAPAPGASLQPDAPFALIILGLLAFLSIVIGAVLILTPKPNSTPESAEVPKPPEVAIPDPVPVSAPVVVPVPESPITKVSTGCPSVWSGVAAPKPDEPEGSTDSSGKRNNGMALTGFILGLASVFLYGLGIVPILGIVFSAIGLGTFNPQLQKNRWMAGVGLGVSIVFTLMFLFYRGR